MKPKFFATPEKLRAWLEKHHETKTELLVGFHKKGSGKRSITWPESVDQALCFGWIDGVRRNIDETSYSIRFTPRKERSTWSAINVARMRDLIERGLVAPFGLAAFERRSADRTAIYSYEQPNTAQLPKALQQQLRKNSKAWKFFSAQAPWYRRAVLHWVMTAKKAETKERRLATLIEDSANERTVQHLTRTQKR